MIKIYKFKESLPFKTTQEIINWVDTLSIPARKPKNISSTEHEALASLKTLVEDPQYKHNQEFRNTLILNKVKQLRLSKEEYEEVYSSVKDTTIKGKYATYNHLDTGSYQRFLDNVEDIEDFLSTLKGYHKKVLNNLIVSFVTPKVIKSTAKYKRGTNTMLINPMSKKVGNTKEEYGSLRYIVLHELGHKFLEMFPQSWNISDSQLITTKYSSTNYNTMSEEEIFAELFALSHWKSKYGKYKKQIEEFEKRLEVK